MCASFFSLYLMVLIGILLGIAGLIILIYGLINKKKNMTITGSIISFLAVLIFVSGIFLGAHKLVNFAKDNCRMGMDYKMHFGHGMDMDSLCMGKDSTGNAGDSGKYCIEKKVFIGGNCMKKCERRCCDKSKCKSKCPNNKK